MPKRKNQRSINPHSTQSNSDYFSSHLSNSFAKLSLQDLNFLDELSDFVLNGTKNNPTFNLLSNFNQNLKEKFGSNTEEEKLEDILQEALDFEEHVEYFYDGSTFEIEKDEFEESRIKKEALIPTTSRSISIEYEDQTEDITHQRQSIAYATIDKTAKLLPMGAPNQIADIFKTQGLSFKVYKDLNLLLPAHLQLTNSELLIKTLLSGIGTCDKHALLNAYLLSKELQKRKQKRENITWGPVYIAQVPGHTFILLGSPNDPNCMVIDSWVIDPHPHLWESSGLSGEIKVNLVTKELNFEESFQDINKNSIEEFLTKYNLKNYKPSKEKLSNEEIYKIINETLNVPIAGCTNPSFCWNQASSVAEIRSIKLLSLNPKEEKQSKKIDQEKDQLSRKRLRYRNFSGQKEINNKNNLSICNSNNQSTTNLIFMKKPSVNHNPKDLLQKNKRTKFKL